MIECSMDNQSIIERHKNLASFVWHIYYYTVSYHVNNVALFRRVPRYLRGTKLYSNKYAKQSLPSFCVFLYIYI